MDPQSAQAAVDLTHKAAASVIERGEVLAAIVFLQMGVIVWAVRALVRVSDNSVRALNRFLLALAGRPCLKNDKILAEGLPHDGDA